MSRQELSDMIAHLQLAPAVVSARELVQDRHLPIAAAYAPLMPQGALVRGTTIGINGRGAVTSLALGLCAEATRSGSWLVVIGLDQLNWSTAEELGVAVDHVVSVGLEPRELTGPGGATRSENLVADVISSAMDAADLIMCSPDLRVSPVHARRLVARARERGVVLLRPFGGLAESGPAAAGRDPWAVPCDVWLTVTDTRWEGIGRGWGHAGARQVEVETSGRRAATRPRTHRLWLPPFPGDGSTGADAAGRSDVAGGVVGSGLTGTGSAGRLRDVG